MNHHKEHAEMYNKHHVSMVKAITNATSAEELSELREAFADISENLIMAIENQRYDEETLYLQHCPMANDSEGAEWISEKREIQNPFYGQKCTTVEKTSSL